MTDLEFESDTFLSLLTEALRSGPGSPSWHQAVRQLREGGVEHADDYQMLVTAREHLESGKGYRAVRAGPLFTKNLMSRIDDERSNAAERPRTTTAIALVCAAAMLAVVLLVGYLLKSASETPFEETEGTLLLVNTIASVDMNTGPSQAWRPIGRTALAFGDSMMHYQTAPAGSTGGAGLVLDQALPGDEPFAVMAMLHARHPVDNIVAQVFVTDDPNFSQENATSPHELVFLMRGNQAQVILPNGRIEGQNNNARAQRATLILRMIFDHDQAMIDMNGTRMWAGPHLLDSDKPRYVGLRFLRGDGPAVDDEIYFQSFRVNTRQK